MERPSQYVTIYCVQFSTHVCVLSWWIPTVFTYGYEMAVVWHLTYSASRRKNHWRNLTSTPRLLFIKTKEYINYRQKQAWWHHEMVTLSRIMFLTTDLSISKLYFETKQDYSGFKHSTLTNLCCWQNTINPVQFRTDIISKAAALFPMPCHVTFIYFHFSRQARCHVVPVPRLHPQACAI